MSNQKFVAGMIAWCNFNRNEIKLLEKIQKKIIKEFKEEIPSERINKIFGNEQIKKLAEIKSKPEIGKKRPVLIIHSHDRMKSVIALPLTTRKPWGPREEENMILLSREKNPKVLGEKPSWVICDMPYHISVRKLTKAKRKGEIVDSLIDSEAYKDIIRRYKEIVADEQFKG